MLLKNRIVLKSRTARKDYSCDMCPTVIWTGEKHTVASFFDGEYRTLRFCHRHNWKEINKHIRD